MDQEAKVYTAEEVKRLSPNYKGKLENFRPGLKNPKPTVVKQIRSNVIPPPTHMRVSSTSTEQSGKTKQMESVQTPMNIDQMLKISEAKANFNSRQLEDISRQIFYGTKPQFTPGMSMHEYERLITVWIGELCAILKYSQSKCEGQCACCTSFLNLIPMSFFTEFKLEYGVDIGNVRFQHALLHSISECSQSRAIYEVKEMLKHVAKANDIFLNTEENTVDGQPNTQLITNVLTEGIVKNQNTSLTVTSEHSQITESSIVEPKNICETGHISPETLDKAGTIYAKAILKHASDRRQIGIVSSNGYILPIRTDPHSSTELTDFTLQATMLEETLKIISKRRRRCNVCNMKYAAIRQSKVWTRVSHQYSQAYAGAPINMLLGSNESIRRRWEPYDVRRYDGSFETEDTDEEGID